MNNMVLCRSLRVIKRKNYRRIAHKNRKAANVKVELNKWQDTASTDADVNRTKEVS